MFALLSKFSFILCAAAAGYDFGFSEADLVFHAFTRNNLDLSEPLLPSIDSIATFTQPVQSRSTVFVVNCHEDGVGRNFKSFVIPAHLAAEAQNMTTLDWSNGASTYTQSLGNAPQVDEVIGPFINIMDSPMDSPSLVRIVGAGHGGHTASTASKNVKSDIPDNFVCYGTHLIPGDNSHYVEGESRYIWMSDGDGVPHLVDLQEKPSLEELLQVERGGQYNEYWLYTRENRYNHQIITHGNASSIYDSNYRDRPIVVIVHGWNSNGYAEVNYKLRDAFLQVMDCNVIVLDWRNVAYSGYTATVNGVPSVGQHLGDFLDWLINTGGGNWNQVHLIGFSIGAHVAGNAGRRAGNRPHRITGLDPAGPMWVRNKNKLRASDGYYVECIHTDGGRLGIFDPICRTNFYPNGGRNAQPGCWLSTCSHPRSFELMVSSVYHNHFVGRQCNNLQAAQDGNCNGGTLDMGNSKLNKMGKGIYGLTTGSSWPF